MSRLGISSAAAVLLAVVASDVCGAEAEWLCERAATPRAARSESPGPIAVRDRFGDRQLDAGRTALLCRSAYAPGEVTDDTVTLVAYRAALTPSKPRQRRRVGEQLVARTRFGVEPLRVARPSVVAFAAGGAVPDPSPTTCYAVKGKRGPTRGVRVVTTTEREHVLRVKRPRRFCVGPTGAQHLCHRVRSLEGGPRGTRESLTVTTALGSVPLDVKGVAELCVPVLMDTPPPEPEPDFFLSINPASISLAAGEEGRLEARAFFAAGGSEDWSDRVTWISSDETVAVARAAIGGAFITAVGPGTTTISVMDPESGVVTTSAGDAEVTVVWPLEALTISPPAVRKPVGGVEEYTVTGHFTGGIAINLTQRVIYRSSRETVASTPNEPGRRSRVHALAPGVAIISATDPISGISTTDAGNDATLRVAGGTPFIRIDPARTTRLVLDLGAIRQFTAVAVFPDGSQRNVTQECLWSSSDETVVVVTPTPTQQSRVEALGTGTATVTCLEPVSGQSGSSEVDVVTGELVGIFLGDGEGLRTGHTTSIRALGTFAPFAPLRYRPEGKRNVTQDVTYVSRDPDVAIATNEPGNRSQILGVGPGTARIYAVDPASGIESEDLHFSNLGVLVGVELRSFFPVVAEGGAFEPTVTGVYEAGFLNLSRFDPGTFVIESDDPTILGIDSDGVTVLALAPGRAHVSARHLETDFVSAPFEVTVRGDLTELSLTPTSVVRAIGETQQFTAIGLFPPDFTEQVTQRVEYRSSDPSVAVATNEPGRRSLVRTVGAGTATISAFDGTRGVSSTDTGGDSVIEVLPGAIERVTITPTDAVLAHGDSRAFTATGHYPDGRTINVTQQVVWTVIDATVARVNGDGPRIITVGPGTTRIVAQHPTGVSSVDSGDDATLVVQELAGITLSPPTRTGAVGTSVRYTVTGHFADGTEVNLTQDASYWVDPWGPAVAPNDSGDRSRIDLVEPATVTINASVFGLHAAGTLTIAP